MSDPSDDGALIIVLIVFGMIAVAIVAILASR